MRKWYTFGFIGIAAILGAVWLILYIGILNQPIPRKVLSQAGFGAWYPQGGSLGITVNRDSVKVSTSGADKLITFIALSKTNSLSFTEQAVPDSFNDVPQVYDKLIEKLRGYSSVDSVNGTVDLTRPEELKGAQTAVMKAKGTLVFIKPDKDLSVDDWRRLLNNLNFVH
jgi:hypothetical protein